MRLLGIDYGRKKMGLAIASGGLSEPLQVLRNSDIFIPTIQKIVEQEQIDQIVIGISENEMGKEIEKFAAKIAAFVTVPVKLHDETLSTKDAQRFAIESGINRKKRRNMEDAYAASVMLQSYVDDQLIAS